jgi:hypothetical protein
MQDYKNLDSSLIIFSILFLIVIFCSTVFWLYNEIEYRKKKWGDIKRPWYSWIWWPSRKVGERIYWAQLERLTIMIPFVVFFWIVFIGKYSLNLGIISAIVSFLISLFIVSKFHHWLEKPKSIEEIQEVNTRKKLRLSLIITLVAGCVLFIPVLVIQMTREDASVLTFLDIVLLTIVLITAFLFFFVLSYFGVSDYYKQKFKKMIKYCPNCRTKLPYNSRFCSECSYKLY